MKGEGKGREGHTNRHLLASAFKGHAVRHNTHKRTHRIRVRVRGVKIELRLQLTAKVKVEVKVLELRLGLRY